MADQIVTIDYYKLGRETANKYKAAFDDTEKLISKKKEDTMLVNLRSMTNSKLDIQLNSQLKIAQTIGEDLVNLRFLLSMESQKSAKNIVYQMEAQNRTIFRAINNKLYQISDNVEKSSFENVKSIWVNSLKNQKISMEIFKSQQQTAEKSSEMLRTAYVENKEAIVASMNIVADRIEKQTEEFTQGISQINGLISQIMAFNHEQAYLSEMVQEQIRELEGDLSETRGSLGATRNILAMAATPVSAAGIPAALWATAAASFAGHAARRLRQGKKAQLVGEFAEQAGEFLAGQALDYAGARAFKALKATNFGSGVIKKVAGAGSGAATWAFKHKKALKEAGISGFRTIKQAHKSINLGLPKALSGGIVSVGSVVGKSYLDEYKAREYAERMGSEQIKKRRAELLGYRIAEDEQTKQKEAAAKGKSAFGF